MEEGNTIVLGGMSNYGIQAWVNSAWCDRIVRLSFEHEHQYTYKEEGLYNVKKCSTCGYRTYVYETEIIDYESVKISGVEFDLSYARVPESIYGRYVTEIGDSVFKDQSAMTLVSLPSHLVKIDNCAFTNCTGLTLINFPASLNYIGEQAFAFTSKLEKDIELSNITHLGDGAFAFSAITSITIGGDLTNIPEMAFIGCGNLESVILPEKTKVIYDIAFSAYVGLKYLKAPSTLRTIYEHAFDN